MQQLRPWGADHTQATRPHAQAEIDVVVGDGQVCFLETADGVEYVMPHGHAGARDGGHTARVVQHFPMPWVVARRATQQMCGHRAWPQRHAGVLDRSIRIQQARTDHTDLRTQRQFHHLGQPIGVERFDIVVEQHKDFATRHPGRGVVHRGPVERTRVAQHAHTLIGCQSIQQPRRASVAAVVVDDQQFEGGVVGAVQDRIDATRQQRGTVACGDDDGDQRQWPLRIMADGGLASTPCAAGRRQGVDTGAGHGVAAAGVRRVDEIASLCSQ